MTKLLEEAVAKIARLPQSDQDHIGRQVLQHVQKLESLCGDIDVGLHELDAGEGVQLDIEDVISAARKRRGKRQ